MTKGESEFSQEWDRCIALSEGSRCLLGCRPTGEPNELLHGLDYGLMVVLTETSYPDDPRIEVRVNDSRLSVSLPLGGPVDAELWLSVDFVVRWLRDGGVLIGDALLDSLSPKMQGDLAVLSVFEGAVSLSSLVLTPSVG